MKIKNAALALGPGALRTVWSLAGAPEAHADEELNRRNPLAVDVRRGLGLECSRWPASVAQQATNDRT